MSGASSSPSPPPSDSPVWSSLVGRAFRPVKERSPELPTPFLYVTLQKAEEGAAAAQGEGEEAGSLVSREELWSMFAPHGEVDGVLLLPLANTRTHAGSNPQAASASSAPSSSTTRPPRPPMPLRQFAFVSFREAAHATHARLALSRTQSTLRPDLRLQVSHALEKGQKGKEAKEKGGEQGTVESSMDTTTPPSGLFVFPSFLTSEQCAPLAACTEPLTRGEVSFGEARPEEDDKFGLRKPQQIPEDAWSEVLKQVAELTPDKFNAHELTASSSSSSVASPSSSSFPSSIPLPNRLTLSILHPGQGLKRSQDDTALHGPVLALVNLGPSHVVLELSAPGHSDKERWGVLMQEGTMVLLAGQARAEYEFAIAARTRDVLPAALTKSAEEAARPFKVISPPGTATSSLKRGKTVVAFLRHVIPKAVEAARAHMQEKQKAKEAEKEKKIYSTAIQIPGVAASTSAASSTSSSTAPASSSSPSSSTDAESAAAAMEQLHVRGVYDSIASHFSSTRHSPWPRIERFVESIPAGSIVADVGCGNGKYMGLNKGISIRGCDNSSKLVQICRERGFDVVEGDLMNVPFPSRQFDVAICIAVLHHISTPARRQRGVRELVRLLKPGGGKLLVSAWALEQDVTSRREFPAQDVLVPWAVPKRFIEGDDTAFEVAQKTVQAQQEAAAAAAAEPAAASSSPSPSPSAPTPSTSPTLIDPSSGKELVQFQRYCHVYREGELEELFSSQYDMSSSEPELRFVDRYYDRGNWCVLVEKCKITKLDEEDSKQEGQKQ